MSLRIFMTLLLFRKKGGMLYTAGLIVSRLQLLFVVVVVLANHNKPRWLTCDPTWRACGEYITLCIHECLTFELCCGTICIQTPTFIIHAASFHYLTHITNAWGCMEILPTHCGAGYVKVNYYRCTRKI